MRRIILLLPAIFLLSARTFAQTSVELIPTAGYTFASRTDFYDTYGRIADGLSYGGSIKFNVNRSFGIEVLYSHMNTTSDLYSAYDGSWLQGGNLQLDYILAGPVESFTIPNSTVRPFVGALLGAAILTPDANSGFSSDTRFAVGFQLGTNIYISPRVGIQLKAQLLSPVDGAGGGFYFSNYGSGGGIDTYSSIYQFSLSGGLIIGLGRVLPEQIFRPHPRRRYYRYY
ncbi:outer membrane beta-barrel protein [Puia dinghuensis]|uniref:outer membrane beta-barrel protein n=1 Tax=Puia dinghuensis TaxID=1792502 RepID=UPI00166DD906|nr:outer membrane beta-barrel protein [Puia dinghuensis]